MTLKQFDRFNNRKFKVTGFIIMFTLLLIGFVVAALLRLPLPFPAKDNPDPVAVQAASPVATPTPQHQQTATSPQLSSTSPVTPHTPSTSPSLVPQDIPAALVDVCPALQQSSGQIYQTAL